MSNETIKGADEKAGSDQGIEKDEKEENSRRREQKIRGLAAGRGITVKTRNFPQREKGEAGRWSSGGRPT